MEARVYNRPAHRVVEVRYRTKTMDIMVYLDLNVNWIVKNNMHKLGRPKEVTTNAILSECGGIFFWEKR